MLERKTTWGTLWHERELSPDDPKPPDDEHEWILEAMAVSDGIIFWSWARWRDETTPLSRADSTAD